jgi:hypothetical protein
MGFIFYAGKIKEMDSRQQILFKIVQGCAIYLEKKQTKLR